MKENNIFEFLNQTYYLPKKVKLFEAFSGIGCQRMAFNRLGIEVDIVGFSEIDKYAIQSYMAIHGETKNYGDITKIGGKYLPPIDVFTWSFPCTDLSKAGKQKGLNNTRSGLVYEVLRIVRETQDKPKVLIMENVVDLVQTKFIREFQEIQVELENMGYMNYTEVLNAKNYGVAQNRERVFMVSILGNYYYEFPKPFKLEKRLKDYLESEVDEKHYLSQKILSFFENNSINNKLKGNGFRFKPHQKELSTVAFALTTRSGSRMDDNFVLEPVCLNSKVNGKQPSLQDGVYDSEAISTAITTGFMPSIKIPEDTKKGYSEAYDGDEVYINRPHQKRGVVQDGMIQTLKTSCNDVGVVVKNNGLRIRKLTPLECWRLMGIDDTDFEKASKVVSNSQLYKQAGNGIVVDVFASILKMMKGE